MRPPPPLISPAPSPQEAAAIVAALERFRRDTAAAPARPPALGGWVRAARLEAVRSAPEAPARWGDSRPRPPVADMRSLNP